MAIKFRLYVLAAISSVMLLSACLPDGKDADNTSDTGKLSGAYYSNALGNLALQIQSSIVNDPRWFSTDARTMELPLQSMNLNSADLGTPIRSFACPIDNGKQLVQLTWLDGRDESGKFAIKTIGTDTSAMLSALRMRVSGENVGTYNGAWVRLMTGDSLMIPASCGSVPIPNGAPVVAFTIDQPARPTQEVVRKEFQTVACPNGQVGAQVESRSVTYLTTGTIQEGNWEQEGMGTCVDSVDVAMSTDYKADGAAIDMGFAAIQNEALKEGLKGLKDMGCTQATVTMKNPGGRETTADIDTGCVQRSTTAAAQVTATEQSDSSDTRELACGQDWMTPLSGFNIPGLNTTSHWEGNVAGTGPGKAVISRNVDMKNVDNTGHSQSQAWTGVSIDCAGKESFIVQCDQIPGAPALEPQQSGSRTYWSSNNNGDWYHYVSTNVMLLNKAFFTGTWLAENENVRVTRPIKSTQFADAAALTPKIDRKDSDWRITGNQCVWAKRVMQVTCPNYIAERDGPGTWDATEGYPGFRPPYIMNFPTQNVSNAGAWMFTWWQQQGELPMHADVTYRYSQWGYYNYSYPFGYYAPDYIRRQTATATAEIGGVTYQGDSWTTLLNKNGVLLAYKSKLSSDKKSLSVVQDGYYEPLRCGRDESYWVNGQPVSVYRMYSSDKGWSKPIYSNNVPIAGVCNTVRPLPVINENTETISGYTLPTDNLCQTGIASAVSGSGPWSWSCAGTGGGGSVSCNAALPQVGVCGSANGLGATSTPSSGLCAVGSTASGMSGSGPWSWSCAGSNGAVACSAPVRVNGQCGNANGTGVANAPSAGLCAAGTASAVSGSGPWNWTCSGSNNGSNASCSAPVMLNAQCGSANGTGVASAPSSGLCATGTASAVSGSGPWNWTCNGSNNGSSASCSAPVRVNGQCGSANGQSASAKPSSGLCATGTASAVSGSGPWNWTCSGSNNGSNASCSASVQCPAVTQPTCTGFTHFVASPNDANGCTTVGTCQQNACPSLGNAPRNQNDCDLQEWNMGPALWYVDGGVDANGCPRAGSCHQETFSECAYRNGWNGTDVNVPPGCCNVYAPGTGGSCNINGEYAPNYGN